jgi:hypothetical protein
MSGAVAGGAPLITLAHLNFLNDGNCAVDANGDGWLLALGSSVTQFLFLDATLDGNGLTFGDSYGTCGYPTLCNVTQAFKGIGATFKNTIVKNFATRPMNFGLDAGQSFIFTNSMAQGWDLRNPTAHGEFVDPSIGVGAEAQAGTFSNFINTGENQSHEALWSTDPGGGTGTLQSVTMDHDFMVAPFVGGSSKNSTIISASIAAGGSRMVVNSITGGTSIGSGQQFACGPLTVELNTPYSGQRSAVGRAGRRIQLNDDLRKFSSDMGPRRQYRGHRQHLDDFKRFGRLRHPNEPDGSRGNHAGDRVNRQRDRRDGRDPCHGYSSRRGDGHLHG